MTNSDLALCTICGECGAEIIAPNVLYPKKCSYCRRAWASYGYEGGKIIACVTCKSFGMVNLKSDEARMHFNGCGGGYYVACLRTSILKNMIKIIDDDYKTVSQVEVSCVTTIGTAKITYMGTFNSSYRLYVTENIPDDMLAAVGLRKTQIVGDNICICKMAV